MYLRILTYCFIFLHVVASAQEDTMPCKRDVKGEPMDVCTRLECLYTQKNYIEALQLIEQGGTASCNSEIAIKAIAATYRAAYKFDEALRYLRRKAQEGIYPELIEEEKQKTEQIRKISEIQSGAYMRNLTTLNSAYNDLIAFVLHDTIYRLFDEKRTIRYFPHIETVGGGFWFHQDSLQGSFPGSEFQNWQNYTNFSTGTVYNDSLVLLSLVPNRPYGSNEGSGYFEILALNPASGREEAAFSLRLKKANVLHPAFSDSTFIFVSDMDGGQGGMDLYTARISSKGYAEITNMGPQINSPEDEVFPAVIGDTLYFASNRPATGLGGLDIYSVAVSGGEPRNVGVPVNTAYDDFGPVSDGKTIKYMLSNRTGGFGGTDIYTLQWAPTRIFFKKLKGKITANDIDLTAVVVEIRSTDGSLSQRTTVDADGFFTLPNVKGMESYEISLVDTRLPEGAKLSLFGEEGNVIKEVVSRKGQSFKFELLTPEDYFLDKLVNADESVLSVDILGMLDSDEAEEGFKIYLQDSEGEIVGVATTDTQGNFAFKSVKPDANYVIKSEVRDPNATIRIVDGQGKTITSIKPKDGNEFAYVRLSDQDRIITLTNEAEKKVKIAESELFNIPVLYFALDDTRLNEESKHTLDKLVVLLSKNPDIALSISGHTDSRGAADYNLRLSQERIDAVIDYLVSAGIDRKRLVGKGYGETRLLNKCGDNVPCTEAQHAENRRTEIQIYQKNEP